MKYKSNNNVVYSCKYHIIWCSKYRRKVIVDGVANRLKILVQDIAKELSTTIIELETAQDHVHILAEVDPQYGVNNFIRRLKGRTSRILRLEFPHLNKRLPTLWTNSYFVSTVGGAPLDIVKKYIENQPISFSKTSKDRWETYLANGKKKD